MHPAWCMGGQKRFGLNLVSPPLDSLPQWGGEIFWRESRPNAGDRLPTIPTRSFLHVNLANHIPRPPDDHLLAFGAEGILSSMARDIPDIDIFQAGRKSYFPGPFQG